MTYASTLVLSLGVAMDSAAVSATRGLAARSIRPRAVVMVAALFGGFQTLMPLIGWQVGARVGPRFEAWDHWIAFVLLSAIGAKMVGESGRAAKEASPDVHTDPFAPGILLLLALATSIDALAVGVMLPMLDAPMVRSVVTMGAVTAALSAAALLAGHRLGRLFGSRLDLAGGIVLIGLGVKILADHLAD